MEVEIVQGDITTFEVDAIVNAANVTLLGGGGVDGCIHRAAGPLLQEYCKNIPETSPGIRCPTGEARITPGFNLLAKYIIHTVGPIFNTPKARDPKLPGETVDHNPTWKLRQSLESSLYTAENMHLQTIAMPAISCGIFGCPIETFVKVAKGVLETDWRLKKLTFVLFQDEEFEAFKKAWEETT